jgi:hypothetical protein
MHSEADNTRTKGVADSDLHSKPSSSEAATSRFWVIDTLEQLECMLQRLDGVGCIAIDSEGVRLGTHGAGQLTLLQVAVQGQASPAAPVAVVGADALVPIHGVGHLDGVSLQITGGNNSSSTQQRQHGGDNLCGRDQREGKCSEPEQVMVWLIDIMALGPAAFSTSIITRPGQGHSAPQSGSQAIGAASFGADTMPQDAQYQRPASLSLRSLLEDETVTKLMFDVRADSAQLAGEHGVQLAGAYDLQLAEVWHQGRHDMGRGVDMEFAMLGLCRWGCLK